MASIVTPVCVRAIRARQLAALFVILFVELALANRLRTALGQLNFMTETPGAQLRQFGTIVAISNAVHTDCRFHIRKTTGRQVHHTDGAAPAQRHARRLELQAKVPSDKLERLWTGGARCLRPEPHQARQRLDVRRAKPRHRIETLHNARARWRQCAARVPGPQRSRARSTGAAWRRYRPRNGCHPACHVSPRGRRALARSLASVTSNMTGTAPCATA
jgi:hypothetical protein